MLSLTFSGKEKVPVFPLEFVAFEIDPAKVEKEEIRESLKQFKPLFEMEIEARKSLKEEVEKKLKEYNPILLENRDTVEEDAHPCFYCVNLSYASFITCNLCDVQSM